MPRPTSLLVAVAALVLWVAFCLLYYPPRVERALHGAAVEALVAAGLTAVQPRVDGREVALVGVVASPESRARAESAVAAVAGVLAVDNRVEVALPEVEPLPPHLEVRSRPEGVHLSGTVPSEARREEILTRARELYGADRVDARLAVDAAVADGAALAAAAAILEVLAANRQPLAVRLDGDALRLSGTVPSVGARRQIEEQAQAAAPRVRLFFSTLVVADGPAAAEGAGDGEERE